MNRSDPADVLADLQELLGRARDLPGSDDTKLLLVYLENARELLLRACRGERHSMPPGAYEANQPARRTATERFQEARRILGAIK